MRRSSRLRLDVNIVVPCWFLWCCRVEGNMVSGLWAYVANATSAARSVLLRASLHRCQCTLYRSVYLNPREALGRLAWNSYRWCVSVSDGMRCSDLQRGRVIGCSSVEYSITLEEISNIRVLVLTIRAMSFLLVVCRGPAPVCQLWSCSDHEYVSTIDVFRTSRISKSHSGNLSNRMKAIAD